MDKRGFTLLEVVVALGVFTVGIIAVIGLFAPVARSVGNASDVEAATNVASAINDFLQRRAMAAQGFDTVSVLLKISTAHGHQLTDADANPNANANDPRVDPQLLFASRDGVKIGAYGDAVWNGADNEKFFEVALIRDEVRWPVSTDPAAATPIVLTYTARIRWPAFVPDATPTNARRALPAGFSPSGAVRFDHSQQQALVVAGSLTR